MLQELISMFLSLFSLFVSSPPRVSLREPALCVTSNAEEEGVDDDKWQPYINKEYENFYTNKRLRSVVIKGRLNGYTRFGWSSAAERSYLESLRRSSRITLAVTFAIFPSTIFILGFLYVDLNTADLCLEWQHHNNTLPFFVTRFRVIGDSVEALIINLWLPLTMVILFGRKEFKQKFFSTFYVAFIFGEATVIYYLFLLEFGVYGTHTYYRFPANVLFITGIICCSIIMLWNIRARDSTLSYSNGHILVLVSFELLVSSTLAFIYKYGIVPFFNSWKEEKYKFMVAAIAPASTVIPAVICKHVALRRSSAVVDPGRSFVLVYFIRGGVIYLYRTMQADLKNIWLFIGLSLFSGFLNFLEKLTYSIRLKLWSYMISVLNQTACCRRLTELPQNTPHCRRLKADIDIQDMLFEYSTLVLSQGYFVLYHVVSFKLSVSSLCLESLKRIAIGIGIDLFFNCFSNFVQIHYYNIPIGRVWTKYWKRHILANFIIVTIIASYFSCDLLSVFQARGTETNNRQYMIKNCTVFLA